MSSYMGVNTYLILQCSFLYGTHSMALMLLTQPADEAYGLPVVLTEEQLYLLHVTWALW